MLRFYFALFIVGSFFAKATSANYLHLLLSASKFDFQYFKKAVEGIKDPEERVGTLSELDEDELTVLGCAISQHRGEAVEFMLSQWFEDIGPGGQGMPLPKFALHVHDHDMALFLGKYEDRRKIGMSPGTSVKAAHEELKKHHERVRALETAEALRTCSQICKAVEPLGFACSLNDIMEEICGSISQSGNRLED